MSRPQPNFCQGVPPREEGVRGGGRGREGARKIGSRGRRETDKGRAPQRRVNKSNLSPHDIPPRGGPQAIFFPRPGHKFPLKREALTKCCPQGTGKLNPYRTMACARGEGPSHLHRDGTLGITSITQPPFPTYPHTPLHHHRARQGWGFTTPIHPSLAMGPVRWGAPWGRVYPSSPPPSMGLGELSLSEATVQALAAAL